ncbi:MAG: DUF2135 domain-containing protein [Treponema sp.]|nr:DUF2135 domain-containing protein [Treponema sp.]
MKRITSMFFSMLMSAFVFAQNSAFIPAPRFIRMVVPEADKNSIQLSDLSVHADITANIAVTTFDMTFTNSSNRVLEGEFEFPLDEGQTVCGFALDVNGKMREGVVVEKEKGRVVFEDIVRRGIDPGLVEVTAGNNFKTRVYPLPAKGSRRVKISIQQEIKTVDGNKKYILNPITDSQLKNFSFVYTDFGDKGPKKIDANGYNLTSAATAVFEKANFEWKVPFVLEVSSDSKKEQTVFVETKGKDSWFYSTIPVTPVNKPKAKINKLGVFVDVSLSAKNRNLDAELELLKSYISSNVKQSVEIVAFSNEIISKTKYKVSEWNQMEQLLRSFVYDGGTDLSVICDEKSYDEILLLSDGLSNWGEEKVLSAKCPVSVISSSISADFNGLKKIARQNGGVFVNMNQSSVNSALQILKNEPYRLIKVEYNDAALGEVYPVAGSIVTEDFSISGLLKKKEDTLKLSFGFGNKVDKTVSVKVSAVDGIEAQNVARLWAQKKIEELSTDAKANKEEILALGQKFTIVTEGTSLIVLENVADYFYYKITPPDELKKEYDEFLFRTSTLIEKVEEDKIPDFVFDLRKEFKNWWNTKPGDFKKKKDKNNIGPLSSRRESESTTYDDIQNNMMGYEAVPSITASARASNAFNDVEFEADTSVSMTLEKKAGGNSTGNRNSAKITIQAWNPDVDYLSTLKKTPTAKMYEKYLELRNEYEGSPSFYMDVAAYFYEDGLEKEAIRIISNLAELNLENSDVLRALGNKLVEFGEYKKAAVVFEKLIKLRGEIPQFYRDAALCYEKFGENQKAADLLYKVISKNWDARFNQVQLICINDLTSLIAASKNIDTSAYNPELIENLPVDMRVVLTWNTDNCDIDLWVTDPDGEKCYYGNKLTVLGGRISRDFTQGYGPEEFAIKQAKAGKYKIQAHYYGSHTQKILQPVVVQAEVYTHFGTPEQKCEILTLELKAVGGNFTIGEVIYE